MPKYSIIVPVYNTELYLNKCIYSILTQSYDDFELILIDDGSTDSSSAICNEYASKDDRVRVIHKANGGVSSARNAGIEIANGEFIWFIDSDDIIEPLALAQLAEVADEKNADLYVFNGAIDDLVQRVQFEEFIWRYYFTYSLGFGPCNKLYRRAIIMAEHIRFDMQETIGEDLLFNIEYYRVIFKSLSENKICLIERAFYKYNDREESAMHSGYSTRLEQQLRLLSKIASLLAHDVSRKTMQYFALLHLISGIGQSKNGGLNVTHFYEIVTRSNVPNYLPIDSAVISQFLKNENASVLGAIRIRIECALLNHGWVKLAGKVFLLFAYE